MYADIESDSWGKSGVRLVRLLRRPGQPGQPEVYDLHDLEVDIALRGDTQRVYDLGDNAAVLSTDAQKNAVYARAKEHPFHDIVDFAIDLARYFVESQTSVFDAVVGIEHRAWRRAEHAGRAAPHSFVGAGEQRLRTRVHATDAATVVSHGVTGLRLLNATGSEFTGFPRDRYTTGRDVPDRILATDLVAEWQYAEGWSGGDATAPAVVSCLAEAFGTTYSRSIQYTMATMADAVLTEHPDVERIALRLPNLHHLPVDLSPFGLSNDHEVFIEQSTPHSMIEATFTRPGRTTGG